MRKNYDKMKLGIKRVIKNFCEEECGIVLEAGSVIVRVRRNEMCQDSRNF